MRSSEAPCKPEECVSLRLAPKTIKKTAAATKTATTAAAATTTAAAITTAATTAAATTTARTAAPTAALSIQSRLRVLLRTLAACLSHSQLFNEAHYLRGTFPTKTKWAQLVEQQLLP